MNGCKLEIFRSLWIDTRYNTEVEHFFKVIENVGFAYDKEVTRNIVYANFFISKHNRLNYVGFRGAWVIQCPLIIIYLIQTVRGADWYRLMNV